MAGIRRVLCCLHGFLGRGADWDSLAEHLAERGLGPVVAPDLFAPGGEILPFRRWVERFPAPAGPGADATVLLGYSLGARLALHLLLADPGRWRAGVLVAPGPGLESGEERAARIAADREWARRFRSDPWDRLVTDWEAQPVFAGRAGPERLAGDYDRELLARAMELWSTGVQEWLLPRLAALDLPLLLVVGERDIRYVHQARRALDLLPQGELWIAPGAAHRVPWEAEAEFNQRVGDFLSRATLEAQHE